MESKKIALVTTHNANNYGAVLQAYASQKILSNFGDVTIVNYDNRHVSMSLDYIRLKPSLHGLLGTAKDLCRILPRIRAINKFKSFSQEYFNLSHLYNRHDLLQGQLEDFDVYVTGSDQIWNPGCINENAKLDPVYFSFFAPPQSKKISFASSWGGYQFNESEKNEIVKYLRSFSDISMREKDSQEFLETLLSRPVMHSLDPTLLLDKDEWSKLCQKNPHNIKDKKYILMYSVPKLPFLRECVDFVSRELSLPVIIIDQDPFFNIKGGQKINDAGPIDFLSLFMNAAFVVTDSFHGVCFSTNFNIPFIATSHFPHSNRIISLLKKLNLMHRLIKSEGDLKTVSLGQIFDHANKKLNELRIDNANYLKRNF